ncbi:MAG: glycosyltransferase family 2 protein [Bacteroidia bacterium]
MSEKTKISVVIPVYNSAGTVHELITRIHQSLDQKQSFEIVLIDDGSKDDSWKEIVRAKKNNPHLPITAIQLSKNYGQHNAIMCGFSHAKGRLIVTMDDDLQHPPEEIEKLVQGYEATDADIVYGSYKNRQHDVMRNTGSFLFRRSAPLFEDVTHDGSSFRLIRRELIEQLITNNQSNFFFIDEILQWYTSNVTSVPVEHHPRKAGVSGYSKLKLFRLYIDILINYTAVPLKFMTYVGITVSVLSFCLGMYFIFKKIFFRIPVPGFTATIVTVLFSTSLILICLGIIGQYLYRIFLFHNKKPPYSVKTIL